MIKVEKFIPGGFALGTSPEGKKMFFWNALPGETVLEYEITKNKSSYAEAIATSIKNPSPYRKEPKDECFLSTSPWQILDYDYELEQKSLLVQEIFREHDIKIDAPEVVTDGKDYKYRNKMEYALYYDIEKAKIFPAFHARGSHRKIPISKSSLERPEIFEKALEIIDDLNARGEEARKYQSLLLRCNQNGEVSGGLYENKKPHPVFNNLKDKILGQEYSYSPNGFFQINLPVYEMALLEIKKHIVSENVLDLYAGVGTIGLSVAKDRNLTLVEVDKAAYKELENNAKNAKTILAKSEDILEYIAPDQTVILDPPRAGCDKELIDKLVEVIPEKIIYLSCNPATQARDIKLLSEKYQIELVKTFNFFPHTPHIENLVILERKNG
ncbi:class I SAM-dependent RNA methyltransferase [Candidatus Saccharibacteria bacterium]|nr:class I SAM-dependent RNA methyltransferase [Candidatus Saccharibacteria bacterium]